MDFATARHNMIESQLRTNKVVDEAIVDAMSRLPRESFVPDSLRSVAYVDDDVQIGRERYLLEPLVFARLAQELSVKSGARILIVGAGSGYGAAVLERAGATVLALESDSSIAAAAKISLSRLNVRNISVVEGPLHAGWPSAAPYDAILIEGAVGALPDALAMQVAPGGRIVGVIARPGQPGRAVVWAKFGNTLTSRVLFDANVPVLPGLAAAPEFVF
ncbi:MAG: protein-L-isoaspartate O-methyltransferase [Rhodospirillales bacterium]|nr:protein-L-isoaspartate O-methyltransferase [Rhodospirillales bacterium]